MENNKILSLINGNFKERNFFYQLKTLQIFV